MEFAIEQDDTLKEKNDFKVQKVKDKDCFLIQWRSNLTMMVNDNVSRRHTATALRKFSMKKEEPAQLDLERSVLAYVPEPVHDAIFRGQFWEANIRES